MIWYGMIYDIRGTFLANHSASTDN